MEDPTKELNKPATARIYDGTKLHWSEPFEGNRISIIAFLHSSTKDLDDHDLHTLKQWGFNIPNQHTGSAGCGSRSVDTVEPLDRLGNGSAVVLPPDGSRGTTKRTILEYCCGPHSHMGRRTPHSEGCKVIRLTEQLDMTTAAGLEYALAQADEAGDHCHLWSSIPCTGGSPWQKHNIRVGGRRALQKVRAHIQLAMKLWRNLQILAHRVINNGGTVTIEWPDKCAYWNYGCVKRFLKKYDLKSCVVHGCAFGLTSIKPERRGKPILKPWRIATNCLTISSYLNKQCPGQRP